MKIVAELFGFPEGVSGSEQLSGLAPLDLNVKLSATRDGGMTNAAIELGGKAGTSDIALTARALGDPAKPGEAKIDIDGKVAGEKPQAVLVLLFPDLPLDRIATPEGSKGRLIVKFAGVPNVKVTGKAALETAPIEIAFVGEGSLQPAGLSLAGKGAVVSKDASAALALIGLESPPSASGVPLSLRLDIAKQGGTIDLNGIAGSIAGENVTGSARLDQSGAKTRFSLNGRAGSVSLPSLLGVLVAWHRTPSTEELLGTISGNTSELWPSRGFSLGLLEEIEGEIALEAKTLSLGSAVKVEAATLAASVGKDGLDITALKGRLFGGELAASGNLAPRGNGAELAARADIKGGKLEALTKSVAGSAFAKGPFDLAFNVQGEGLSAPGVVAGLSGEGTLTLGAGTLQSLSAAPLRGVAATAAKKTIKADKEEIEAEARGVREKITKGTYKFAPATLTFDIKNGTLRVAPATLASAGAETKINGFVELASLKLDSEWALSLTGAGVKDVPPVSLVFTGALAKAGEIAPAIDTGAIEAYLTMRRMQEDVERLETLDMSGRTEPPAEPESGSRGGCHNPPGGIAARSASRPGRTGRTVGMDRRDEDAGGARGKAIGHLHDGVAVSARTPPGGDRGRTRHPRRGRAGDLAQAASRARGAGLRHGNHAAGTGRGTRASVRARARGVGDGESRSATGRACARNGTAGPQAVGDEAAEEARAARCLAQELPHLRRGLARFPLRSLEHIEANGRRQAQIPTRLGAPSPVDFAHEFGNRFAVCPRDFAKRIPEGVLQRHAGAMPRDGERTLVASGRHAGKRPNASGRSCPRGARAGRNPLP